MTASFKKYILNFKKPSGTSRGILRTKETYFLLLSKNEKDGVGECGLFKGLSADDRPDYEKKMQWLCENINLEKNFLLNELSEFPSIQFGLEQAFLSLQSEDKFTLFPSKFTKGKDAISINGLIWMGSAGFMTRQIKEKLAAGFTTLKLKIGAIDFDTELEILKSIRKEFTANEIELRVDANGAFTPQNALDKLKRLSDYDLHSIEQPIEAGQWQEMASLCEKTPLPIALDEELIGIFRKEDKARLLETINPQYIILKPSLVGGFQGSNEWINISESNNVSWWITSALESNIGLNAIAQFTYSLKTTMPQGLGTGGLFTNNFDSPLEVNNGHLHYNPQLKWQFSL
ncbi:o-succinylbenzoate synthase [Aureibaculum sp. 2210JD6-5]|uniref:o-succinylbenzoate synthase n=1 Tax=Aureibaculum sp. 2210JD6-5 TaxID=3103957 RepID=UPI002AAF0548|nr:o-succinylbenzoate synthase [Aureibaculum sp. 2210JD6-5]MDY7393647.1 o-succinylbenzoate synthase [Aureibaculum sp. 2210JD6-5]